MVSQDAFSLKATIKTKNMIMGKAVLVRTEMWAL